MIDETQGSGPSDSGQESSFGGASEWSTVTPPSPPVTPAAEPAGPASSLEPLPQTDAGAVNSAAPPLSPPSAPNPADYQAVYGTNQPPPNAYASGPEGYPPPPPPPPPPQYGAPGGPSYPPPSGYPPPGPPPAGQGLSSQAAAAISYITFIPAVVFLVIAPYNRDRFVRFHAWQCIALTVVAVIIAIVFQILGIVGFHVLWWLFHSIIDLLLFIFWLIALIKASQGQWYRIPIVGDLADSFAGKR